MWLPGLGFVGPGRPLLHGAHAPHGGGPAHGAAARHDATAAEHQDVEPAVVEQVHQIHVGDGGRYGGIGEGKAATLKAHGALADAALDNLRAFL